jgi:hypothetical protein
VGWSVPPLWDPIAGDYATRDGWIRLHTNAPHHRAAAETVLGACADRSAMASKVAQWAKATWSKRWSMQEVAPPKCARGRSGDLTRKAWQSTQNRSSSSTVTATTANRGEVRWLLAAYRDQSAGLDVCSPALLPAVFWPASAPTSCVSIRRPGTNPAWCRK